MSGILGVLTRREPADARATGTRMLGAMRWRGSDEEEVLQSGSCTLGVARQRWELGEGFAGPVLVLREGELAVAADASLYYRRELARKLASRGIEPRGSTPSHLILAAYRAWGEACPEQLEGDFAFVLWDAGRACLLAARDFGGSRPLFFADLAEAVVVASTVGAVLAHPRCPDELNLAAVGEAASGMLGATSETCYRAIQAVPAGWTLLARSGEPLRLAAHWYPPRVSDEGEGPPFAEAALQLRELLGRAVVERCLPDASTTVWLSGGWDSTAVFGAGRLALGEPAGERLRPVSVSYPPGDPGREDELIEQVARRWEAAVHWVDINDVPLLPEAAERAAARDEPHAHPFEMWNHALALGSRAVGSHVALTGRGGDDLFAVSSIYLADLLRRGRWLELYREWHARPRGGVRDFIQRVVKPALPDPFLAALARVRRRRHYWFLERRIADWIEPSFAREHRLHERQKLVLPSRPAMTLASAEIVWLLLHPYMPRTISEVTGFALLHGVEVRSPIFDGRVVEFAATRPRRERASGVETKLLLRRSMRGLLPDAVLEPRPRRTGVTSGYLFREMRERWSALFLHAFANPVLAELGVVNANRLQRAFAAFQNEGRNQQAAELLATLQAELWLRAKLGARESSGTAAMAPHAPGGRGAR